MPPKVDPKKSKAKKGAEVMTEDQVNEELAKAKLRLQALKGAFQTRMEEVASSRAGEMELSSKLEELQDAYKDLMTERFDIVSDFTRQHKATEDELIARITLLDSTITDLKDQKELSTLALRETIKERDHYIALKQREYEEQEKKMREMEAEFTHMLADTQNKMTDRVEATLRQTAEEAGDLE